MLILKVLLGAILVILIDFFSNQKNWYFISSLIPLFPTFGILALIFVYSNGDIFHVKKTAEFGLLSLIPYAGFLITVVFLCDKLNFYITLLLAILVWLILSVLIILFWENFCR